MTAPDMAQAAPVSSVEGYTPAPDFTAPNWTRCPSTHCERSEECRSPSDCSGTGFPQLKRHTAELTMHVKHLLQAIDRGYFGEVVGLRESAFVTPLRAYVRGVAK